MSRRGGPYNPSADTRAQDYQPTEREQRMANRAVAALDGMQRLRLLGMLMNRPEWRREETRWQ